MAKYTDQEKMVAVLSLDRIRDEGFVNIDGKIINNVRDLCKHFGIGSGTLYRWNDTIERGKIKRRDNKLTDVLSEIHEISNSKKEESYHKKEVSKDFVPVDQDDKLIVKSEIRFFGNLASMLNVRGYSDMPLKQLQLAIGLKLVQRSGLGKK